MLGWTTKTRWILRIGKNDDSDLSEFTFAQDQGYNIVGMLLSNAPHSYHESMSTVWSSLLPVRMWNSSDQEIPELWACYPFLAWRGRNESQECQHSWVYFMIISSTTRTYFHVSFLLFHWICSEFQCQRPAHCFSHNFCHFSLGVDICHF